MRRAALASAALFLALAPAAAQRAPAKKPAPAPQQPAEPAPLPDKPPYEAQMLRMSELLGALAYLRDLCGAGDGGDYRARMEQLIEAEQAAPREKLAGAYNRGYRGYEAAYSHCTPNAQAVVARFLAEAGRIARDIGYRYGGA